MRPDGFEYEEHEVERYELDESPRYTFILSRRAFVQVVSAGLLITWGGGLTYAQRRGRPSANPSARFLFAKDGSVTAYTGKVEVGQGSRTQIAMAVAEELGIPLERINVVMADTDLVPNDGGTWGSRTTPDTIPTMRKAAAAAKAAFTQLAADTLKSTPDQIRWENGQAVAKNGKRVTLADLAKNTEALSSAFDAVDEAAASVTEQSDWRVLGQTTLKTTSRGVVTGLHQYPSDIIRPGMLYGKILRPPGYNSELIEIDLAPAKKLTDVTLVHDGNFVGVAAKTTFDAEQAILVLAKSAKWSKPEGPDSDQLSEHLAANVAEGTGRRRSNDREKGDVAAAFSKAATTLSEEFHIPYIQHAPMEPRAAVAEWNDEKLTAWTGTQNPFGVRGELTRAFGLRQTDVRVHVPDTGGGFGGKHTGDAAIEAARLSKATGKPVRVQWTREEEFIWAYFRPAGLIKVRAGIDGDENVTAWEFINHNSGGSGLDCPYDFPNVKTGFKACDSPLREGSYRALASTANHFAREVMIDRLARLSETDPLEFRQHYLTNERQMNALDATAKAFGWEKRDTSSKTRVFGIACGTEKASYIATAVELEIDPKKKAFDIVRITCAYECGAIQNPKNVQAQVEGSIVIGLGGALTEQMHFAEGIITNPRFKDYAVPKFEDVPPIEVVLLDRPDLPSVGAGETPIITIAPAIANALASIGVSEGNRLPIRMV